MKKLILLSALSIFTLAAYSQVEFRPFLGANFSNVSKAPDNVSTQAKLGGAVGVGLMFGSQLYLYPSVSYFSRSTKFSFKGNTNINTDQKIEGVSIPILLGLKFIDYRNDPFVNGRIFAGPSMMFMTQKKFTNTGIEESVNWNTTQWGAHVGAGVDISVFFADLGYEFGLSKTNKSKISGGDFKDIKNNTFYINLGLRLVLAR